MNYREMPFGAGVRQRRPRAPWAFVTMACFGLGVGGCGSSKGAGEDGAQGAGAHHDTQEPDVPLTKIDRSGLTDVGTGAPLDYGDPRMWLCRPGNDPDECDRNLDATELLPDGTQKVEKHVKATDSEFDCFYVSNQATTDLRPPFPYHFAALEAALGLHLLDYALEMDDLIEVARQQGAAATGG